MRCDVCDFSFFGDLLDRITCWLLLYVDDILISHSDTGLSRFRKAIAQYKTGDMEYLEICNAVAFLRMNLERRPNGEIDLIQTTFIQRMAEIIPGEIADGGHRIYRGRQ